MCDPFILVGTLLANALILAASLRAAVDARRSRRMCGHAAASCRKDRYDAHQFVGRAEAAAKRATAAAPPDVIPFPEHRVTDFGPRPDLVSFPLADPGDPIAWPRHEPVKPWE